MGEEEKKNKVRLKICGSQFLITADESRQYIQKIAGIVDKRIKQLSDSDQKLSVQMATIVAALNYCDQLEKEKVITRELIKKTDDCESIARDATMQLNKLLVENQQLKEEKAGLHRVIAELKAGTYVEEASWPIAIQKRHQQAQRLYRQDLTALPHRKQAACRTDFLPGTNLPMWLRTKSL